MAKHCLVKDEEKINTGTVYRVMWKDHNFAIHEKKFKNEFEAKAFFESIDKPNRLKELDMIKEAKYYTIYWTML